MKKKKDISVSTSSQIIRNVAVRRPVCVLKNVCWARGPGRSKSWKHSAERKCWISTAEQGLWNHSWMDFDRQGIDTKCVLILSGSREKPIIQWLLFLVFKIIYFNWRLITLQYCSVFLPYIDMNQSWVYMCQWLLFKNVWHSHGLSFILLFNF